MTNRFRYMLEEFKDIEQLDPRYVIGKVNQVMAKGLASMQNWDEIGGVG